MNIVAIEKTELESLMREVVREELADRLNPLMNLIVLQQKDAKAVAGVSADQIQGKARRGEIDILQRDGSRLNYLTLTHVSGLKPRLKKDTTLLEHGLMHGPKRKRGRPRKDGIYASEESASHKEQR